MGKCKCTNTFVNKFLDGGSHTFVKNRVYKYQILNGCYIVLEGDNHKTPSVMFTKEKLLEHFIIL